MVDLFSGLPEVERRGLLISYAEQAQRWAPAPGETFILEEVRKDAECSDTVGIYLQASGAEAVRFKVSLGPEVQTLTRAMTTILCQGLNGISAADILQVPPDFVPKIVGTELVRLRSQTVYYILARMQSAVKSLLCRLPPQPSNLKS